eukprot:s29_g7.t1
MAWYQFHPVSSSFAIHTAESTFTAPAKAFATCLKCKVSLLAPLRPTAPQLVRTSVNCVKSQLRSLVQHLRRHFARFLFRDVVEITVSGPNIQLGKE